MSKNHQKQHRIRKILVISDNDPITLILRARLIKNTNDKIGIISTNHYTKHLTPKREAIFPTSLKRPDDLAHALKQENFRLVYINLTHPKIDSIHNVVLAMNKCHLKRLIMVLSSMNNQPVNEIANLIKKSDLDYTIIRTAQINHSHLLSYQIVKNAQPVNDSSVSINSVADLAFQTIKNPRLHSNKDLGIAQLPYK